MDQIIGFAKQFYTLWDYEAVPQFKTDSYGNYHQVGIDHKYYYCKNVSTDLDKVKSLFPNVQINSELRGTSSFSQYEKLDLPNNFFWFGKYAGKLIDEVLEMDFNYCLWSAENYNMPYITNHPKYVAYFQSLEEQKRLDIEKAQIVNSGDLVELEFLSNGYNTDEDFTECWVKARLGETQLIIRCNGAKLVSGKFPYVMPMVNGKFQKTKGEKISVKVLQVFNTNVVGGNVEQRILIA